jgi:hypothetical protein
MKSKFVLLIIVCMSCGRQDNKIKQMNSFSESDFLITQDSVIAKLDKLSYITQYTLLDDEFKMKFILDSQRINITAFDSLGRAVWRTDPWLDNKLMTYRLKRPRIIYFGFVKRERSDNKEVIGIDYNNTQFGMVDKRTGKFTFWGQD